MVEEQPPPDRLEGMARAENSGNAKPETWWGGALTSFGTSQGAETELVEVSLEGDKPSRVISDSKKSRSLSPRASKAMGSFFRSFSGSSTSKNKSRKPFSPGKQAAVLDEDDYDPQPALLVKPNNQAGFVQRVLADLRGKDIASFERVVGTDRELMNVAPNVESKKHLTFGKAKESERRKLERAAYLLVEDIKLRIDKDLESRSNMVKLGFYLLTVAIFMNMVMFQATNFSGQNQVIHETITSGLFTDDTSTLDSNGGVKGVLVFPGESTASGVLNWFSSNVLNSIFTENDCGDDVCMAPEEYPYFKASSSAREFAGCKKDCGEAPTARVIVDFFDPWKLQQAYDTVYNALDNGWDYGEGQMTARALGSTSRTPAAGWNICSRTHNEYGFYNEDGDPVNVCIFDADITIDGLPYRTEELEYGGESFGSSNSVNLFDGEWEVRIAYENFTWGYDGKNIPIAFPAVRGQIINFDSGRAVATTWDGCAAARNCTCEWYRDGQYYCIEPRFYDEWSHEFGDWVEQENIGWVAEFLGMNMNYTNPSDLNTTQLEDDTWIEWKPCKNAGTHSLILLSGYMDQFIYKASQDDAADDDTAYFDDDAWHMWGTDALMQLYEVDPVDGGDNLLTSATIDGTTDSHKSELEQYMCPDREYKIKVTRGADDDDGDSRLSWALYRNFDYAATTGSDDDYMNVVCEYPCKTIAYDLWSSHGKCSFYGSAGTGVDCGGMDWGGTYYDDAGDDSKYWYYDRRLEESDSASVDVDASSAAGASSTTGTAYAKGASAQSKLESTRHASSQEEASVEHLHKMIKEHQMRVVGRVVMTGDPMSPEDQAAQEANRRRRLGLAHDVAGHGRRLDEETESPTNEPTSAPTREPTAGSSSAPTFAPTPAAGNTNTTTTPSPVVSPTAATASPSVQPTVATTVAPTTKDTISVVSTMTIDGLDVSTSTEEDKDVMTAALANLVDGVEFDDVSLVLTDSSTRRRLLGTSAQAVFTVQLSEKIYGSTIEELESSVDAAVTDSDTFVDEMVAVADLQGSSTDFSAYSVSDATTTQNSRAPTIAPTDPTYAPSPAPSPVPTPAPTTSMPTASPVPTTPEEKASVWDGFSLAKAASLATLPFTIGTTDCTIDSIGDGVCDASSTNNNDMNCGFDDGDCCYSTCFASDGTQCSSSASYSCQSNAEVTKRVSYSVSDADWPFMTPNNDLTYPFSTQKGIMEVLRGQGSSYADDYTVLPSLTCPDCNSYNGSYLSIPFTVNTSKGEAPMFPDLEETRERTFMGKYRVLGGVLLTQQRNVQMSCQNFPEDIEKKFGKDCNFELPPHGSVLDAELGKQSKEPFGVDPTYVSTESLYRSSNSWEEQYTADELKSSDTPYGFFYDGGCTDCKEGHRVRDYPIMFDVNFNVSRTAQYLTMLEEGGYIDTMTSELKVSIPLMSLEFGKPTIVTVTFNPLPAGGWNMNYDVVTMDFNIVYPNNYFGLRSGGNTPSARDWVRVTFELLWYFSFFYLVSEELVQLRKEIKERGHPFGYFFDMGNMLDILNFVAQWTAVITFYDIYQKIQTIKFTSDLHYDVYADEYAVGRLAQTTRVMADFQDLVETVEEIVDLQGFYSNTVCISFLLVCLQLLKNLDFHPKLGIITRTIGGAASDLAFFMLLFIMVNGIFAFLGCFIFGNFSPSWSTLPTALLTCLSLLIGLYDPTDDIAFLEPDVTMANVFLWSFQVVTFFVLLNALLAIIVESYDRTKQEAESERSTDVTTVMLRKLCGHHGLGLDGEIAMSEEDMVRCFTDMSNNIKAVHRVTLPGTKLTITRPIKEEAFEWKVGDPVEPSIPGKVTNKEEQQAEHMDCPWVLFENIDGTHKVKFPDTSEMDVELNMMQPLRKMQVRVPNGTVQAMVDREIKTMQSNNLFYMLNKYEDDGTPRIVLLDQTALVCAMRTVCPTMSIACAYGIALNVLVRYGVNADINGDGVISPDEWAALDEILREQEKALINGASTAVGNRSRLIALMF